MVFWLSKDNSAGRVKGKRRKGRHKKRWEDHACTKEWTGIDFASSTTAAEDRTTVKILKFGTPQTIAIIVLKIEKFDVTLH